LKLSPSTLGFLSGLLAYSLWGVFPLFFYLLRAVPATEVLLHRVVWSCLFVALILLTLGWRKSVIAAVRTASVLKGLLLSSMLISANWLVFIWAVANGRVLESSLGYFLTPLFSVFLARVFLRETLNNSQRAAILLAGCGVLWLVLRIGYLPWVSLVLALSFSLYGLVRKQVAVNTLTGLTVETAMLTPLALGYWVYLVSRGEENFGTGGLELSLLLVASGIITALPLLLFASATRRLSLSVVGFMMYINPTLQFLTALFILDEPFSMEQLIGFCFIWCALLVFTLGTVSKRLPADQRCTEV
jgi:chloramphenicol-sensitive protein RarD